VRIDGGKTETDSRSNLNNYRRSFPFSRITFRRSGLVGAGWSVVSWGYFIPGFAIENAALLEFAFGSESKALSHRERAEDQTYPPRVKMTLTVVSTSTGSLLSR
jgi:hypothetical protein